jgi:hypothetical protein
MVLLRVGAEESEFHYLSGLRPRTVMVNSSFRSKYLFSSGANLYDKPVVQSEVFVSLVNGIFLDVWNSVPVCLHELGDNYATEIFTTVGWMGNIKEYTIQAGLSYEDIHHTLHFEASDYIILSSEVLREFKKGKMSVSPFARTEVNFTRNGSSNGDVFVKMGSRYEYSLCPLLTLKGKMMVVYDPGIAGGNVAWVGNIDMGLWWKWARANIEFPYIRFVQPLTRVTDGRKADIVYGAGMTFTF